MKQTLFRLIFLMPLLALLGVVMFLELICYDGAYWVDTAGDWIVRTDAKLGA